VIGSRTRLETESEVRLEVAPQEESEQLPPGYVVKSPVKVVGAAVWAAVPT
jgi:hypothetical protein